MSTFLLDFFFGKVYNSSKQLFTIISPREKKINEFVMKILHTSDLHVGKKLMGRERYGEYRAVFDELAALCVVEEVELLLIAGDVFDTYTPSAESEEIFYSGVKKLAAHCAVLVISGNHDDNVRLTAASALAEELNVYLVGNNLQAVRCEKRGKTYPVRSDSGWVIFGNERGERVYINTLPYPNEARFKEGKTDESFEEKMSRWIDYGQRGNTEKLPSIFLSHLFVAGGTVSDSEREIDLGGARVVPTALLPDCDYCALGHLHKRQKLGKNAYYCGAPMQFTFDESGATKSVNLFDLTAEGVKNFHQVEISGFTKLIRLQAADAESGVSLLKMNPERYVELTLNLAAPLTAAESAALHGCENLLSLRAEVQSAAVDYAAVSNKDKSSSQLFTEYYKLRYGGEAPEELLALFLSMTEEEG